jgi:hypothetical protein
MDHNMQHKRCKHQHHSHNIHLQRVARRSQDIQPKEQQQQQRRLRRVERERERQHQLPKEQQQQEQREQQHVVAMEGQFHQDVAKVQHALQRNDKINTTKTKRYWLLTDLLVPSGTDSPNSAIKFMYSLSNWLSRSWD